VAPGLGKINTSRYKTELCRPFQENGTCKYAEKCQFAHGIAELRTISRHPKYKTDLCRTYHSVGFCPYGPRCHFIHSLDEAITATATTSKSADVNAAITALKQLPMFSSPDRRNPPTSKKGIPLGNLTLIKFHWKKIPYENTKILDPLLHHDPSASAVLPARTLPDLAVPAASVRAYSMTLTNLLSSACQSSAVCPIKFLSSKNTLGGGRKAVWLPTWQTI